MPIKPELFQWLVAMFEAGPRTRTIAELKEALPNQDIAALVQTAFQPDGYCMWYPIEGTEYVEAHEVEPGKFCYFNSDWYPVDPGELKQYRYSMDWLPGALKTGLHISGKTTEIVPGIFLRLGYFRFMDQVVPIWLARHLSRGKIIDDVYDALAALEQDREGIIITQRRPESMRFSFPGDYRLVDPVTLLNEEGYLSTEYLAAHIHPKNQRENTLIYWDEDRGLLYLRGREPIQFTGSKNRKAITLLYDRCLKNDNKWNIQALLEEIGSSSTHISKLFRGHPHWKEVIGFADGMCWLIIPKDKYLINSI